MLSLHVFSPGKYVHEQTHIYICIITFEAAPQHHLNTVALVLRMTDLTVKQATTIL